MKNSQTPLSLATLLFAVLLYSCSKSSNPPSPANPAPPAAPTALAVINFTDTSLIAQWQPVTGATSYDLFVATDTNFANPVTGYNPKSITDTVATITPLSPGTKYYYKVVAINSSSTKSAASNIIVLATPLASADGYVLIGNSDYNLY